MQIPAGCQFGLELELPVSTDVCILERIVVPYTGNEPERGMCFGKIESHLLVGVPRSCHFLVNQTVRSQLGASVFVNTAANFRLRTQFDGSVAVTI